MDDYIHLSILEAKRVPVAGSLGYDLQMGLTMCGIKTPLSYTQAVPEGKEDEVTCPDCLEDME